MYYMNERWRRGAPYIKIAFPYSIMKVTTIRITAACLAGSFSLTPQESRMEKTNASKQGVLHWLDENFEKMFLVTGLLSITLFIT